MNQTFMNCLRYLIQEFIANRASGIPTSHLDIAVDLP
jgi:hypothetical protein